MKLANGCKNVPPIVKSAFICFICMAVLGTL